MTVYRYTASIPRHIHLDQPANVTQCILIVSARSRAAAAAAFAATGIDCTPYTLKHYGSETGNRRDIEVAEIEPGEVWACPLNNNKADFVRVMPRAEYLAAVTAARYTGLPGRDDMMICKDCTERGRATYAVARDDVDQHNRWHETYTRPEDTPPTATANPVLAAVPTATRYEARPLDVYGVARWIVWDRLNNVLDPGAVKGGQLWLTEDAAIWRAEHINSQPENRFPWPEVGA